MSVRLQITALVYMMVQAVMFGAGLVIVEATNLRALEMTLIPADVIVSGLLAAPIAWWIAPRLRARYWRAHRPDFVSG